MQRELFGIVKKIRDDLRRERDAETDGTGDSAVPAQPAGRQDRAAAAAGLENGRMTVLERLRTASGELQGKIDAKRAARMLAREREKRLLMTVRALDELCDGLAREASGDAARDYALMRNRFAESEAERRAFSLKTGQELENAFHFLAETFGEGQEMVIFLSELSASVYAMKFIQEYGSREYDRQSRLLLLKDRRQALREEIFSLTEEKE